MQENSSGSVVCGAVREGGGGRRETKKKAASVTTKKDRRNNATQTKAATNQSNCKLPVTVLSLFLSCLHLFW
jgi:hypothetical protein